MEKVKRLRSGFKQCKGKEQCDLKVDHSPNGPEKECEFNLGCGMCTDKIRKKEAAMKKERDVELVFQGKELPVEDKPKPADDSKSKADVPVVTVKKNVVLRKPRSRLNSDEIFFDRNPIMPDEWDDIGDNQVHWLDQAIRESISNKPKEKLKPLPPVVDPDDDVLV